MNHLKTVLVLLFVASCVVEVEEGSVGTDDQPDPGLSSAAAASSLTWPTLAVGDAGDLVVAAQYLLQARGRTVTADGDFGTSTQSAVVAFQRASGLATDGVIGAATWEKLISDVRSGSSGPSVRAAQRLLITRIAASISIDGSAGASTVNAITAFQRVKCLGQTGVVGLYTWNSLASGKTYCTGGGGGGNNAADILARHNARAITLWDQSFGRFDGADPLSNIKDAAAGRAARRSTYGGAPGGTVPLGGAMLGGLASLTSRHQVFVTAISGASHSANSYHYAGRAFDVDEVDGTRINGDSSVARAFMDECRRLGAIEVLGPSNDAGHQDHLHCAW
ncbi:MAG: peptidoglycan-binding protein [Kofleriaceae bacterium]